MKSCKAALHYFQYQDEQSEQDRIIFRGNQAVIPVMLTLNSNAESDVDISVSHLWRLRWFHVSQSWQDITFREHMVCF